MGSRYVCGGRLADEWGLHRRLLSRWANAYVSTVLRTGLRDVTAGFISIVDRQGKERRYPLVSVSIGVAVTGRRHYADHRAIVAVATEMKVVAKAKSGSAVAVDRRTDAELGRGDGAAAGEVHTA